MATFIVDTRADAVDPNDGRLSLREVLALAQGRDGRDRITFDADAFEPGAGRIVLTQGELAITAAGGPVRIDGDLDGNGAADVTLDAGGESRVLSIRGGPGGAAEATLEGLVMTGGLAGVDPPPDYGGPAPPSRPARGGGILAELAEVTIRGCVVAGNRAFAYEDNMTGGGIFAARSTILVEGSAVSNNSADNQVGGPGRGGGLATVDCEVTLRESLVEGNRAYSAGGGLFVRGGELTVAGSSVDGNFSGEFYGDGNGGGIAAYGSAVTLAGSSLSGNGTFSGVGRGYGGGLWAQRCEVAIRDSAIEGNSASANVTSGGGIAARASDVLVLRSEISGNRHDTGQFYNFFADGGGIWSVGGTLDVVASTIADNLANSEVVGRGGGIFLRGTDATLVNATVSGNAAVAEGSYLGDTDYRAAGGGLFAGGGATVAATQATIVGNAARGFSFYDPASGLYAFRSRGGGIAEGGGSTVTLANSIVAGNRATADGYGGFGVDPRRDVGGSIVSNGANLFSQAGIDGALADDLAVDPGGFFDEVLTGLRDNGGPTLTHRPRPGSPAIDAGDTVDAVGADGELLATDQRGSPRVRGDAVDVGAVEAEGRDGTDAAAAASRAARPPEAADDAAATTRGRPVRVDVLANDAGPDGGALAFAGVVRPPESGLALAVEGGAVLLLPRPGVLGEVSFEYAAVDPDGARDTATVTVEVRPPTGRTLEGDDRAERLTGGRGDDYLSGLKGGDVLLGRGGDDVIYAGDGPDLVVGGAGDDVLLEGGTRNDVLGGPGADLFLLDRVGVSRIRDLDLDEGDRLGIAIAELIGPDGRADGDRIRLEAAGAALLVLGDAEGDGTFALLARLVGGAGLAAEDVLVNAIA